MKFLKLEAFLTFLTFFSVASSLSQFLPARVSTPESLSVIFSVICTGSQCPAVTEPIITSQVICQVSPPPSQGPPWGVSYTCNVPDGIIHWSSSILAGDETITFGSSNIAVNPSSNLMGLVNIAESHTTMPMCLNSTLTLTGTNLTAVNGESLSCRNNDNSKLRTITIAIPSK